MHAIYGVFEQIATCSILWAWAKKIVNEIFVILEVILPYTTIYAFVERSMLFLLVGAFIVPINPLDIPLILIFPVQIFLRPASGKAPG